MTRLAIRVLGPFQASLDGRLIGGFHSDKVRALLAYLCVEAKGPHRREKLAGLLWPDLPERSARTNLRHSLANLRQVIGDRQATPPPLLATRQTIQFNRDSDAWVDAQAFISALQATQHPIPRLEEGVELYRGEFLEGFSLLDSSIFEEWLLLQREYFQRLVLNALHRLAKSYTVKGEYERALAHAWRQLELDPLREQAQRQSMLLLALSGRRSEALTQYHMCRRLLAEELGVAPSAETMGLFEQIRDGILTGTAASPQRRLGPTHNLPLATGPFVGREAEIAAIQACLQDPACRLLTLVGAGGMGKTRLALEAVRDWMSRLQENDLEGATLVPLAPVQAAKAIAPAISQAADFPHLPGREPEQQLLETLRQKRWLLILDSFEHLPDGAGFVVEILRTAPYVKVLVTSRARLNLQGESCFPIAGIKFPEQIPHSAQEARTFAAVQLFLQTARRVQPGLELADIDLAEIGRVCRLVRGMPLGILLAAAWSGVLSPAEIATEIEEGLDFMETDWTDVPERQRSIRAVFDGSWSLLTEPEREIFQALSVFSGGFSRAAAQQVSGASLHELRSLAGKSLIQHRPSGRYEIHELLRQYAAEKLYASPGAATDVADRHSAYFMTALQGWETDLTGPRQPVALVEMEAESRNIDAAWTWAVERGQVERLDEAMEGLEHFCWQSGRYQEAKTALQAAATAAAKADCPRVQARALAWQSCFQRAIGQRDAARRLQEQCLTLLQVPALAEVDTRLERAILNWARGVTVCMADFAQGRERFEDSFYLFRALDHQWGMAWALNACGTMSMLLSDYGQARQRLEEGLALYRTLGNQSGIAGALSRLAQVAYLQGRFEDAEDLAREGTALSLEAGSRTESALALLNLGEVLEKVGKLSEAHSVLLQSLESYTDLEHRHYITQAHGFLGSVELHRGRYQQARDQAHICLDLAQTHGPRFCAGLGHLLLGCLDLTQGAPVTAHQNFQEAVAAYREAGPKDDLGVALVCLAMAAREGGDSHKARQHLGQALEIAQQFGAAPPQLWALPAMALLLADERENERAVELYALASRFPLVSQSRWFASVVGNTIAEVAATLPAEQVSSLQELGRTRDLEATAAELLAELSK